MVLNTYFSPLNLQHTIMFSPQFYYKHYLARICICEHIIKQFTYSVCLFVCFSRGGAGGPPVPGSSNECRTVEMLSDTSDKH